MKHLIYGTALALLALFTHAALAHGQDSQTKTTSEQNKPHHGQRQVEPRPFGQEGDPKRVTRSIRVDMSDAFRFTPSDVVIRRGETVRFVVSNSGQQLHEMVLGTAQDIKEHAELMKKFPTMEHDDANMAHVQPGAKGEIVWQFTQAGEFQFACLLPGHYEAGMVGKVVVK